MKGMHNWRAFALVGILLGSAVAANASSASLPEGFSEASIARPDGRAWADAMGLAFDADGRLYVYERAGRVWLVDAAHPLVRPIIDLSQEVAAIGSLGLTGFALDPAFVTNGYLYLFFTVEREHLLNCDSPRSGPPECRASFRPGLHSAFGATLGRLVRYRMLRPAGAEDFRSATRIDLASRQVLIGESAVEGDKHSGCLVTDTGHGPGALAFGADGSLLAACGDGASVASEDGGSDPNTAYAEALALGLMSAKENVGAFRAQLVDSLSGKILRLDPATGDGLASNPFFDANAPRSARSRVYALGLRNPQHFTVRPDSGLADPASGHPGTLYIGDVGYAAWESLEVAANSRANFGWPLYEGLEPASSALAGTLTANLDAPNPLGCIRHFRFQDLIQQDTLNAAAWPNPCQKSRPIGPSADLFLHTRPVIDWLHAGALARWAAYDEHGEALALPLGTAAFNGVTVPGSSFGGSNSVGGTWYGGSRFPADYQDLYFHADAGAGWIKAFRFDANDNPLGVRDFASNAGSLRALATSPAHDGLYYLTGPAGSNLRLITYRTPATPPLPDSQEPRALQPATRTTPLTIPAVAGASTRVITISKTPAADTQPPTTPTGLTAISVTDNGVTLSWTAATDLPNPGGSGVGGYYVYRNSDTTTPVATVTSGTSYTDSGLTSGTAYTYQVAAFDKATPVNVSAASTAVTVTTANTSVPAWVDLDIGVVGAAGSSSRVSGTLTVKGAGTGSSPSQDNFHFLYVPWSGDGALTARIVSQTGGDALAKTGLMFRAALSPGAVNAYLALAAGAVGFEQRAGDASTTRRPPAPGWQRNGALLHAPGSQANPLTPIWLRLIRQGTAFTAYSSPDGIAWAQMPTGSVALPTAANVGFAVSSHSAGALSTAVIDSVSLVASASADLQPPTVPTGLTTSAVTMTTLTLSWNASTDLPNPGGTGVGGYFVYRNGSKIATVASGTSYADSGLNAQTSYSYQLAAFDKATPANVSALSTALSATTAPDTLAPTVPAGLAASAITMNSLTLSWGASTDLPNPGGTGVGGYYVLRNSATVATVTSGTSFADSGLAANTSYSYAIEAYDRATPPNVSAASAALAVTTSPPPPPSTPTGLAASAVTGTTLSLSWTASTDAGGPGVAGYYVFRNATKIASVTSGTSYADAGLTGNTTYQYQVEAFDKTTPTPITSALSSALPVTTGAPPPPSTPTGLASSSISATTLTLSWTASTDVGGPGIGGYLVFRNGTQVANVTVGTSFTDSGLTGSTSYLYTVQAYDKTSPTPLSSALSTALSVTTTNSPPPSTPTGLAPSVVTGTTLTLSWTASTDAGGPGVAGYYVFRNGTKIASVTSGTSYPDSGLTGDTSYQYQVQAFDKTTPTPLTSALSAARSVTTGAPPPPSTPTGLATSSVTYNSLTLSWTASTDTGGPGIGGYNVIRNGTQVATVTSGTSFADSGLSASTTYTYTVQAFDRTTPTPETSGASSALGVTTSPPPPPSTPTGLAASSVSYNSLTLSWTASTDAGGPGIGGYTVFRNGTQVATVTSGTSYADSGLSASTTYTYTVQAFDRTTPTPETSGVSSALGVTTSPPPPPSTPTGLAASAVTATSLTLSWTASSDVGGPGIGGYYVFRNGTKIATVTSGTSFADSSLAENTTYQYQVQAYDKVTPTPDLSATSAALGITTNSYPAPSTPTGLATSGVTTSALTLSWTASTDAGGPGVGGYTVYRNGVVIAGVGPATTSYADSGLSAATSYQYQVQAYDSAVPTDSSALSSALQVTTATYTPPSTPTGLSVGTITTTSVVLSWTASSDAGGPGLGGYYLYRNGSKVGTVTSGTSYTDTGLVSGTTYEYQVAAFDTALDTSALSAAIYATTGVGWSGGDIGSVAAQGSYALSSGTFTVNGSGADIWSSADAFQFVSTPWTGDVSIIARVYSQSNTSGFAKAGVMVRETLAAGASEASTLLTPSNGALFVDRSGTGSASNSVHGPGVAAPYWVQIVRQGNQFTSLISPDGNAWTTIGSISIPMASSVDVGLAVTSHDDGTLSTVVFDHVSVGAPVGISLSPANATVYLNQTLNYTATVTDASNPAVNWQVNGVTGGSATTGTISATSATTATYTPPASITGRPSYTVAAVSAQNPAASGSTTVYVLDPNVLYVSPRQPAITTGQTQQFSAVVPGNGGANWSVDGIANGNTTVGTIDSTGLYAPPSTGGTHAITATSQANGSVSGSATVAVTDLAGVYTYHNDLPRTGQNLHEYALTPASVSAAGGFGKLFQCTVDGAVYAQPLYVANVTIAGGTHNVVIVATEHDGVYAFDADLPGCVQYWYSSFVNGGTVTPVPAADLYAGGDFDILAEVGITGTPVINPAADTLYVVAKTKESGVYHQRLHALSVVTGAEQANSPVDITASIQNHAGTTVNFDPLWQNQRPGLVYIVGTNCVYISWASHGDSNTWYGWVMAYDGTTLVQTALFNSTPDGSEGGIWMSGAAPAVDSSGSVYLTTGNGTFDDTADAVPPVAPNDDFSMSFLKLSATNLKVQDYYTPSNAITWSDSDFDISAAGLTVLPDGAGPSAHPDLLVGSDKQGHLWLIDRSSMSRYSPTSDNVVQMLSLPNPANCNVCVFGAPAYWNGRVYLSINGGSMMAFTLTGGLFGSSGGVATAASNTAVTFGYPAPTGVISAAQTSNGILWLLDNVANGTTSNGGNTALGPAVLRGYDATNLGTLLYSSSALASDTGGNAVKFTVPTVANGRVYVGGAGTLTVYGLLP
jgi:chitodextrinase/regulation of enolase protein 1 (concanavalin A-like superfamily)